MPSPIGHALAGIAAGWLVDRSTPGGARTLVFGLAGAAADVDLLVGAHSGPTHGIGAAVMAAMLVAFFRTLAAPVQRPADTVRLALAVMAAYATHPLLDWLSTDTSPPVGIMALWPLTRAYYESSAHVFMAISRRYWLPEFWTYNLRALARELLILLPVLAVVFLIRRPPGFLPRRNHERT